MRRYHPTRDDYSFLLQAVTANLSHSGPLTWAQVEEVARRLLAFEDEVDRTVTGAEVRAAMVAAGGPDAVSWHGYQREEPGWLSREEQDRRNALRRSARKAAEAVASAAERAVLATDAASAAKAAREAAVAADFVADAASEIEGADASAVTLAAADAAAEAAAEAANAASRWDRHGERLPGI